MGFAQQYTGLKDSRGDDFMFDKDVCLAGVASI